MSATAQMAVKQLPKSRPPVRQELAKRLPIPAANRPAPVESARYAGLRYVSDTGPAITRRKSGASFTSLTPAGRVLRDVEDLQRIKSLVIPPAWTDVWISPDPR